MTKPAVEGRNPKLADRQEITVTPYKTHAEVSNEKQAVARAETD
jgi:hypothetical protein